MWILCYRRTRGPLSLIKSIMSFYSLTSKSTPVRTNACSSFKLIHGGEELTLFFFPFFYTCICVQKLKAPPSKLKLHYWAYHGQDPEAKKGADSTVRNLVDIDHYSEEVNSKDSQGNRPLHHAAARNNVQTVNELLEAGAEVDAANDSVRTRTATMCMVDTDNI